MCRQCRRQYISMLLWILGLKEDFVKREALPLPFLSALDRPLGISDWNRYQNGSIPSQAFCLWSSLWLLLALPWIHPRADLIKVLTHVNENFIPTKFHQHSSSGSVVKADYVCSHIYTCISEPPPPFLAHKQEAIADRTLSLYSQPIHAGRYGYKMWARVFINGDGCTRKTLIDKEALNCCTKT